MSSPLENKNIRSLRAFFNVGYYLLIFPFRVSTVSKEEGDHQASAFLMQTNLTQQILCGISHCLILLQYLGEARTFPMSSITVNVNPGLYFLLFTGWAEFVYKIAFVKSLWEHKKTWQELLDHLSKHSHLQIYNSKSLLNRSWTPYFLIGFFISVAIMSIGFGYGVVTWYPGIPISYTSRRYISIGMYNYFLSWEHEPTFVKEWSDITTLETIVGAFGFVGICLRHFFAIFADGFILITITILWISSKELRRMAKEDIDMINIADTFSFRTIAIANLKLNKQGTGNFLDFTESESRYKIMANYDSIRSLAAIVNKAMSQNMLCYTFNNIILYAQRFNFVFPPIYWLKKVRHTIFFALSVCILYFAGEICRGVDSMVDWFNTTKEKTGKTLIDQEKLVLLLDEVKSHRIGISGRIFNLDYVAIFNIIGTAVTYFAICATASPV